MTETKYMGDYDSLRDAVQDRTNTDGQELDQLMETVETLTLDEAMDLLQLEFDH